MGINATSKICVMMCSVHPIWTVNGPNKPKWTSSFVTNVISLFISWRLRFMYYIVLYQWPNQWIEWTHATLDCISHSELTYTYAQWAIFCLNRELMQGLVLMTDYSYNKFHFGVEDNLFCLRILNDCTVFLKKKILLKMIIAVHWFGICSPVWCRAKIFDLDQAAFCTSWSSWCSVHLCMSPFK